MINELIDELNRIADWWLTKSPDTLHGGFVGEISHFGNPVAEANKGIVLNSRLLWFFSELALYRNDSQSRAAADTAFHYLIDNFDDTEHGGVVWELAADGSVVNDKKQIYALCFCIYAFSAYFRLTGNPLALTRALEYFGAIETYALDNKHGGYVDAFSREWQPINDRRLGAEDMNAPKTMNTHLHLLEAYSALYLVAPSALTDSALRRAIELMCTRVFDRDTGHLQLFFDLEWNSLSASVSCGHDIEASWLLWEAGNSLGDAEVLADIRPVAIELAETCRQKAIGHDGGIFGDVDTTTGDLPEPGVWWVQAEGLVGFLNAYRLTGDKRFKTAFVDLWHYIRNHHIDTKAGEWHWYPATDGNDDNAHYKAGFWKAPYHTGRAMLESVRLLRDLDDT